MTFAPAGVERLLPRRGSLARGAASAIGRPASGPRAGTQFLRAAPPVARSSAKFLPATGVVGTTAGEQFQGLSRSARSKHFIIAVIDPPVTEDERLTDALAAFGLLCDRAIEYLDLFTWSDGKSSSAGGSTAA